MLSCRKHSEKGHLKFEYVEMAPTLDLKKPEAYAEDDAGNDIKDTGDDDDDDEGEESQEDSNAKKTEEEGSRCLEQ